MQKKPGFILLIGYRQGLHQALLGRGHEVVIWTEVPVKKKDIFSRVIVAPFPERGADIRRFLIQNFAPESIAWIFAGTEAAVYPAAVARYHFLDQDPQHPRLALYCHDKLYMKHRLSRSQIPMTKFVNSKSLAAARCEDWGWPVICKNRRESGGRGLLPIHSNQDLAERCGVEESFILEKYIDASEISIESFIQDGKIQFTNITEYFVKKHINVVPGQVVHSTEERLLELNRRVIAALGITNGITHVELYLTPAGPLFGEIALRPPGGYIMELLKLAYGFDPWAAYAAMIMGESFSFPQTAKQVTACQILHPGAGVVASVEGHSAVQAHPNTQKVKIKVKPGSEIQSRSGAGEDLGYVLQRATKDAELRVAIEFVREHLIIQVRQPSAAKPQTRVS